MGVASGPEKISWEVGNYAPVHLSKHLPPYHGHLINDEVTNACPELLDGLQPSCLKSLLTGSLNREWRV